MRLTPRTRDLAGVMTVALAYVLAARAGLALAVEHSSVAAIWAPSGIALAALVLGGRRLWPGVALGALIANAGTDAPTLAVLGITAGNTLEALAGAALLRAAGLRPALDRARDVLALVALGGALSTIISATVGVLSLHLTGQLPAASIGSAWRTWWLGDMGGDLLVAPLILIAAALRRQAGDALPPRRLAEAGALLAATIATAAFALSGDAPLAYALLPLPIWAALRFGPAGAAVVSFIVAAIAVATTAGGVGAFAGGSADTGLLLSQTFAAVGAVTGLLLAAVTAERSDAQAQLAAAHRALEAKVLERTAALARTQERLIEAHELLRIGSWEWDVPSDTVSWSRELYAIYGIDPAEHEATFTGYLERVHPDDRASVQEQVGAALRAGGEFAFDERIVRPDGTIRTLASRGQVHRDGAGHPLRMVGICQDVTESRRAERALRDSEERARLIIDAASDAFISTDEHDRITDWNAQARALFGWTRDEALGRPLGELIFAPLGRARHRAEVEAFHLIGTAPWIGRRVRRAAVHRDGHEFPIELTISPVRTERGLTLNAFMYDVSERLRRERFQAAEHAVTQALLESATLDDARPRVLEAFGAGLGWIAGGWWGVDDAAGVARCEAFWRLPGTSRSEAFEVASREAAYGPGRGLAGRVWQAGRPCVAADLAGDDDFPSRAQAAEAGLTAGVGVPLHARGEIVGVLEFFAPEQLHLTHELTEMVVRLAERVSQFIERMAADKDLREAEERFHRAFEDAGIGMALIGVGTEDHGRLLEVNDALSAITGYPREELQARRIGDITHPDDRRALEEHVCNVVDRGAGSVHGEGRLIDACGDVVWIAFSTSLVRDDAGRPLYRISQLQDITERKRFEGQLQHLADHDTVTGLLNRRRFDTELARELAGAQRYGTGGAVLALDLDNFKYVNDTLGHGAGDRLIVVVADILRSRLRATDTVARLGGDEFAVILPHVDERDARAVAGDLLAAIRREAVVSVEKGSRRTTASIGIALFPAAGEAVASEEVLVEADIAMYDAKESGRDRACVYDAQSSRQQTLQTRMAWAEEIREALAEDRFVLHAQPIVPLQGDGPAHHELLVRMVGRDGDLIPPSAFLPVAERLDLVQEIDRHVVRRAIELLGECTRRGDDVRFGVNLSGKSLGDVELPGHIARQLDAHGADPSRLFFEVTETAAIVNVDRAKQFARSLGELGCGFALDDFGTGFASLYYLKHLPFDFLKIDGEFVESLPHSPTNQLVVQSLVTIARGLGKQTIAERVGDDESVELLRSYGVDYAQGYHLGRPCPPHELGLRPAPERVAAA